MCVNNYDSPCNDHVLLQTRTVNPMRPEGFILTIEEVINGLGNINRYNGNTNRPYSVAEHSLNCCWALEKHYPNCPDHMMLYMMLHDASEVVTCDLPRPIKLYVDQRLIDAEITIQHNFICSLPFTNAQITDVESFVFQKLVKEIDTRMAVTEMCQFFPELPRQLPDVDAYDVEITEYEDGDFGDAVRLYVSKLEESV